MWEQPYQPDTRVNSELEACEAYARMCNRQSSVMNFVGMLHEDVFWPRGKWDSLSGIERVRLSLRKRYEWGGWDEPDKRSDVLSTIYLAMTRKNGQHCCVHISPDYPYRVSGQTNFKLKDGKISKIEDIDVSVPDTFADQVVYLRNERLARLKVKELVNEGLLFRSGPVQREDGQCLDRLFS